MCCFLLIGSFIFLRLRIVCRALGSGAPRAAARAPRRKFGPWPRFDSCHVLWGFKVARKLASNHGGAFRARKTIQAHKNSRTW